MSKERFEALQREIARLKEIDKQTSDRVAAELDAEDVNDTIVIECSAELDQQMANESENIQ